MNKMATYGYGKPRSGEKKGTDRKEKRGLPKNLRSVLKKIAVAAQSPDFHRLPVGAEGIRKDVESAV